MSELIGKKALVVGGSRGIGAAIVERLANDGADVVFTYAGAVDAAAALSTRTGAKAVQSDAADRLAMKGVIGQVGPLDILVHNAGMFLIGPALDLDPADVDRMIDVNARAPYHTAVEAAREMNAGGRIVLIGSSISRYVAVPGVAAYAMTKASLEGTARGLSRDFGERDITVNVISPGPIDTDMNPADGPMAEQMHGFMAMKRHGSVHDIAGLVAYLVGPAAAMVTGTVISADGGWAA